MNELILVGVVFALIWVTGFVKLMQITKARRAGKAPRKQNINIVWAVMIVCFVFLFIVSLIK